MHPITNLMEHIEISNQERECLEYLRQGLNQEQISVRLLVSLSKVERTFKDMREKFNCENNYKLLAFAYENKLISANKGNLHNEAGRAR